MNTTNDLWTRALELPREQRHALAICLLDSLDEEETLSEEEWKAAWLEEVEARIAQLERGETRLLEWEEVEANLRRALEKPE